MIMMEKGMAAESSNSYPPPLAAYQEVAGSRELFLDTLKKLHVAMGTKFMIPIVGGKDLDLHRLFVEVTSRGGITKVVRERKWKEVTAVFCFPTSATNASFILRKYYSSLLYHYEQIYLFKAKCWTPLSADASQNVSTSTSPPRGLAEGVVQPQNKQASPLQIINTETSLSTDALSNMSTITTTPHGLAERIVPPQKQEASPQQIINSATSLPEAPLAPSPCIPVSGVIDGKFEGGYLVTVKIGSENLKGVLYQVPQYEAQGVSQHDNVPTNYMESSSSKPVVHRRNRRKKAEIKRRDPEHPKPNISGYNFFFAEQQPRLKPLYSGREKEISKVIGELWNNLQEPEKSVYQEKALRDKERYRQELEDYNKRRRIGQSINNAAPIQQFSPMPDAGLIDIDKNIQIEGEPSAQMAENETSFNKSNLEGSQEVNEDLEMGASFRTEMENKNVNLEISKNEDASGLQTGQDVVACEDNSPGHGQVISNVNKNVNLEISKDENASGLQTGQDVVGCEDNSPGHGQIVSNAVPIQQFLPIADAGLMDLAMTVQTEGNASAYENSSANSNLEGYAKMDEDSVMGASFQAELELENLNVEISPNGETTALQMEPGKVGCKANNPGLEGMEEKEDVSIPVEEGEVDPINTSESVAISKGHESH